MKNSPHTVEAIPCWSGGNGIKHKRGLQKNEIRKAFRSLNPGGTVW